MSGGLNLTLRVWRQNGPGDKGRIEEYQAKDILDSFPQLLFPPGDEDSLAEKIENLILEKEDKKKNYREHVLNKYDIKIEVNAHEKIYKELLKINQKIR